MKPLFVRPRIGHGVIISATAEHGRKFDTAGARVKWSTLIGERTKGINTAAYGGPSTNGLADFDDLTDEERDRLAKIRRASEKETKFWQTLKGSAHDAMPKDGPRLVLANGARRLTSGHTINLPLLRRAKTASVATVYAPLVRMTEAERPRIFAQPNGKATLNERLAKFIKR